MNNTINQPEKLSLWDRLFNRYRKVIHQRGHETWEKRYGAGSILHPGQVVPCSGYNRDWIEYKIIDRVTGSETIDRVYLN